MPRINPQILSWARETAGLTLEAAAKELGLHDTGGVTAAERLAALESGEVMPTRPILRQMAEKYRRPLVAFYMSHIPNKGDRGEDFRTLPEGRSGASDALLDALLRDIRARQSIVRSILEELDECRQLRFIGSANMSDGVGALVASIRQQLDVEGEDLTSAERRFDLLRSRVEAAGVFVLLIGKLGSHHTAIDLDTFRGFALPDDVAPFIVINDQDARPAWSFTLVHELAHLWLGETGVSGTQFLSPVERFCNDVASEFLLPMEELRDLDMDSVTSLDVAVGRITRFANERNISRSMVAYRLYRAGTINQDTWRQLNIALSRELVAHPRSSEGASSDREGGPNYYVVRRHKLGRHLLELVRRTMAEGLLSPSRAGKVARSEADQC
jgi:Zn-dependent peptidase ImmA (M78 family)/transcriptional regulator with XRE-family HTH domain